MVLYLLSHGWISSPREGIFLLDQYIFCFTLSLREGSREKKFPFQSNLGNVYLGRSDDDGDELQDCQTIIIFLVMVRSPKDQPHNFVL